MEERGLAAHLCRLVVLLVLLAAAPAWAQTITGLTPTTYRIARLTEGSQYYVDRPYTLSSIPPSLAGGQYVMVANADKVITSTVHITFAVDQPVTVFIAYDSRATALPTWLGAWAATGETLGTTDVPLRVYRRAYPTAGTVTLGGNQAPPGDANTHYVAVVQPLAIPPAPAMPGAPVVQRIETRVLEWQDNAGNERETQVERSTDGGQTFEPLTTLPPNPTNTSTYTDRAVQRGVTYCYRVRAANEFGLSAYSNVACH